MSNSPGEGAVRRHAALRVLFHALSDREVFERLVTNPRETVEQLAHERGMDLNEFEVDFVSRQVEASVEGRETEELLQMFDSANGRWGELWPDSYLW